MQGALDNAAKDPDNFGIAPEEMQRRRSFVSQTRAGANSIRDTLAAAKSVKSARKERMERQGLLAGRGSSSCEMASGKLYLLWPYLLWHYLLWLYLLWLYLLWLILVRDGVRRRSSSSSSSSSSRATVNGAVVRRAVVRGAIVRRAIVRRAIVEQSRST